jgi:hypothetical protein
VSIAQGNAPRPPAFETAIASALPCTPAIGAWMIGTSMPNSCRTVIVHSLSASSFNMPPVLYTVGHSTRTADAFIGLLEAHGVTSLADVRTVPGSRHNPQFNGETLAASLAARGIGYVHLPGLGGFRRASADSPNAGWRNVSFRGYADYMQTPAFADSLANLLALAADETVAVMCAEAVPWRCHRSLIADALVVRGIRSEEIVSETKTTAHELTPFARVDGTAITYPALT